jgi:spore germination protein GerM
VRRILALLLLVAVAGCGLSANSHPQEIASADLPPDLATPSTSSSTSSTITPTSSSVTIYYLVQQDGVTKLHGVARDIADATRPRDRLAALLAAPTPEEQATGVLTSIPADTLLLDSEVVEADQELVVDLSRSLFDVQGQELRNAFAQIVWTATEISGIRQVRFRVDGEDFRVPDEDGIEQSGAVSRSDYISLAP